MESVTKSVYIAGAQGRVGKSAVALGLIETIAAQGERVGIFRPLVKSGGLDTTAANLIEQLKLDINYEDAIGVTYEEWAENPDECLSTLVTRYSDLASNYDVMVVLGSDFADVADSIEVSLNAHLATNFNAPVIVVVNAAGLTPAQVKRAAQYATKEIQSMHNQVLGAVATRVAAGEVEAVLAGLSTIPELIVSAIQEDPLLGAPSVREQFTAVNAAIVNGSDERLDSESLRVMVLGMSLTNVLRRIRAEDTVVLGHDRVDLLPGLLASQCDGSGPRLAGVVLVGGTDLPADVKALIDELDCDLPIAATEYDSSTTTAILNRTDGEMLASGRKLGRAREVTANLALAEFVRGIHGERRRLRTEYVFEYEIFRQAQRDPQTIVLPESEDNRILESAAILLAKDVVKIVLLGEAETILAQAAEQGFDLSKAQILSTSDPERLERYAKKFAELRAKKGVTYEQAVETMKDPNYFGSMMVLLGEADGMVSGAAHTTADTIRPALQFIKTRPGVSSVSGAFFMCMPDQVLLFADCAVTTNPDASTLADIAISSADTAAAFGIEPRVAMLSYSTGGSGAGPSVELVVEATKLVKERRPDIAVDGPLQFDAAYDPTTGASKAPKSPVAGKATVFVFPDLDAGNIAYKAVQRTAHAVAVGPVLQGLNKPVTDLSRGALVDDIVSTVAITAIQAQQEKRDRA